MKTIILFCALFIGAIPVWADQVIQQEKINTLEEFNETLANLHGQTSFWVAFQGAQLEIEGLWNEDKPNASAGQQSSSSGYIWTVIINGGLARDPNITKDAFILTYCHELGHHFGGFPFFTDTVIAGMAVEGQADYYSSFCLKSLWKNDFVDNKKADLFVNFEDRKKCDDVEVSMGDRLLCYRIMNAIRSKERWYDAYDALNPDKFDGPIGPDVSTTYEGHPGHACRIQTMEAGYFCPVNRVPYFIPGKDSSFGAHSREAELATAESSCMEAEGIGYGFRPRCWFAPKVDILMGVEKFELKELKGDMDNILEPGETFKIINHVKNYSNSTIYKSVEFSLTKSDQYRLISSPSDNIADLKAQETFETHPAEFQISKDLKCGQTLNLDYGFSNAQNTEKQSKKFNLGTVKKSKDHFISNKKIEIPDINSFGNYGISSITINNIEQKTYDKVFVKFKITHSNRADLMAYLISPGGKRYIAFEKRALVNTDDDHTFTIPIKDEKSKGRWTIEIRDLIQNNKGFLHSWEMSFGKSVCMVPLH